MSTRTFKIGNAEIFQDKPNELIRALIEIGYKKDDETTVRLVDTHAREIAELLANKSDADLSVVLRTIVRMIKELKQKKV